MFSTHATQPVPPPFSQYDDDTDSSAASSNSQSLESSDTDLLQRLNGHYYTGQKTDLLPHGTGSYTFSSGTIYSGSFSAGQFHGEGIITFPTGARYIGEWKNGVLQPGGTYYFADRLQYQSHNWKYCTVSTTEREEGDRRFWSEVQTGIKFESRTQLTDKEERRIPYACYDLGDCYLDPKDDKLYHYDGRYYRDPTPEEKAWAKRKARVGLEK